MWPINIGPIPLYQGDTWTSPPILLTEDATGQPVDVEGWAFRAQLKVAGVRHDLMVTHSTQAAVGDLPAAEVFSLSLPAETAAGIRMSGSWDLEGVHTDGTVRTWLRGTIQHREDVTR